MHLDISRSSLFLLLKTLKKLGYVEQAERRGRYHLGPRLQAWRSAPQPTSQDLLSAFYQEAARQPFIETLALVMSSPEGPIILAQVESEKQVRCAYNIGQVYPHLEAAYDVLAVLPSADVQRDGYSLICGLDAIDLALPVCRDGVHPDAALMLSAPTYRGKPEEILSSNISSLRAMAARLSYRLGANFYTPYNTRQEISLQATKPLTPAEITDFLQGPWAARLACIRPDGRPHVIPVWQEWDGKHFYVIAWQGSQWADYLLQNSEISLTVDEHWAPLRRVAANGRALPIEEDQASGELEALVQRLSYRYLGYSNIGLSKQVQLAFIIEPERLRGWQGLPGHQSSGMKR